MTTNELEARWSQLLRKMATADARDDDALRGELDAVYSDLQELLFGGRPIPGGTYSVASDDRQLTILVDALEALSLLEPEDASYPWDQALVLSVVGRSLEAAHAYLETASRIEADLARGRDEIGVDADWARSALAHAARCLLTGGQAASAAALLPRLDDEDRAEIEPLVVAAAAA